MAPKLNKAWHEANPMPAKPKLDQRVDWHRRHAGACACRPVPASLQAAVARGVQA